MKKKILNALCAIFFITIGLSSCDSEKDLIIIEGPLPIKTSTLYMVGDASPDNWNIGDPTPLTPTDEDPLVFVYEGHLNTGEIKLYLVPGNWDNSCIRPLVDQSPIGRSNITDEPFQMYQGGDDLKWRVTDAGNYRLIFDLRNWKMSTVFLN